MVETNSPSRIPVSRCTGLGEAGYLSLIVDEICSLRNTEREELLLAVGANYRKLFSGNPREQE